MDKALCDQMLGSLAKWLRILGIDTYFAQNTIEDDELLKIALDENRILITRDKELIIRAERYKISTIPIQSTDLGIQISAILSHIPLDNKRFFTRCTICNTLVRKIDKSSVKPYIPKKVYANKDIFWYCPSCNKYYWQGSHYKKILSTITDIIKKKTS
jgi:uncharacterized protein with PIN domain